MKLFKFSLIFLIAATLNSCSLESEFSRVSILGSSVGILDLTIDAGNPLLPTTPPSSSDTTPVLYGSVVNADGGTIVIYEDAMCATSVASQVIPVGGAVNINSISYSIAPGGPDDGLHRYYVIITALDGTPNPGGCLSTGLVYTLDTIPPLSSLTFPTMGSSHTQGTTINIIGTCETGLPVNILVDGAPHTTSCTGGAYNQAVTLPNVSGSIFINFMQSDPANNSSGGSVTINLAP